MFKQHLDGKICATCGRYFQWRKRWANNWSTVRYCSKRCAGNRNRKSMDNQT
ncbi:DUF2256 domain-containing protein [Neiella sp. HB171785]|uniref:DUF2256 domain-containing protein n=1 Tax=Neiella litorisoli TaxID=2771431 RepID=A0A8J6UGU9_9GAMM|nr:DUF2256 domain-containing protein [Neiella litorisoli]MBD1390781.1 DUF2256 domain-containing protein [Neiella litorisoli]